MRKTTDEKIQILEFAKQFGVILAAQKFGVGRRTISTWNQMYKIYPTLTPRAYTREQKIEMLMYAAKYGQIATAEKYNIESSLLSAWNDEYNIYPRGGSMKNKKHTKTLRPRLSDEQQLAIVGDANKFGIEFATIKYNITRHTVLYYARKWGNSPARPYRKFTNEQRAAVIKYAKRHGITNAGNKYAINATLIRTWIKKQSKQK